METIVNNGCKSPLEIIWDSTIVKRMELGQFGDGEEGNNFPDNFSVKLSQRLYWIHYGRIIPTTSENAHELKDACICSLE